jgi:integrase/recombinase XerD
MRQPWLILVILKGVVLLTVTDAMEKYLKKCKIRNLAEGTQDNYKLSLSTFKKFYSSELDKLTQDDIDDYTYWLQEKDLTLTTINNRLRDLRAFLKWCGIKGYAPKISIRLIKQNEPEIHAFSLQELKSYMMPAYVM